MKPVKPDLTVQQALNNVVALLHPRIRPTKKPWLREYALALVGPAREAMREEAFTPAELQCVLAAVCLELEVEQTGNTKLAPALSQAEDLIQF